MLFGDYVDLSPRWAPRLKRCRDYAAGIKKLGGKTELVVLPEIGIKGNSHMLMQDKNSLELAGWLVAWLDKHVEKKPWREVAFVEAPWRESKESTRDGPVGCRWHKGFAQEFQEIHRSRAS